MSVKIIVFNFMFTLSYNNVLMNGLRGGHTIDSLLCTKSDDLCLMGFQTIDHFVQQLALKYNF